MTDRELLQQALDTLRHLCLHTRAVKGYDGEQIQTAIDALKARLSQPEPEPVAWMQDCADFWEHYSYITERAQEKYHVEAEMWLKKLRTSPPKKEWVGLTDEELEFYTEELGQGELGRGVLRAVVDFLKEKNT